MSTVILGRSTWPSSLSTSSLGTQGTIIVGTWFSTPRIPVGDFNKDGYDDIGVYDNNNPYILFGGDSLWGTGSTPSAIAATSRGLQITDRPTTFGVPTLLADVNGDDFDDLILMTSSRVDIVFGRSGTSNISLSTIDGVNATSISETTNKWGFTNTSTSDGAAASGDVNGDGFEDITMASTIMGTHNPRHVWTIMGRTSWEATYDLDAIASELDTEMVVEEEEIVLP